MEKKALDARVITTPLGAALGLAATRALIPEKDRNLINQGIGTATGGAAGWKVGDYLEGQKTPDAGDVEGWKEYFNKRLFDKNDKPMMYSQEDLDKIHENLADLRVNAASIDVNDPTSVTGQQSKILQGLTSQRMTSMMHRNRLKELGKDVTEFDKHIDSLGGKMKNSLAGATMQATWR